MGRSKAAVAVRDMERCVCSPAEWVGRVTTATDDGEASVWVCGLAAHRDAAERWVRAVARQEPRFVPKQIKRERLFDVEAKQRWSGSRALVPLPSDACPECGSEVEEESVDQRPLIRHGGYGAAQRTTMRHCRCGWRMQSERGEVKP